jgi:hypothetical protein
MVMAVQVRGFAVMSWFSQPASAPQSTAEQLLFRA